MIWVVNWARYYYQSTAVEAGSIECIPDQLIFFEGGCHVKDLGATRTHVDGAKVPQIGSKRLWKGTVEDAPTAHSWQGE